jgi:hypothetical protein
MPKITYEYARYHVPYTETVEGSAKDVARRAMLDMVQNTAMPKRILLSSGKEVWSREKEDSMEILAQIAGTSWMDV